MPYGRALRIALAVPLIVLAAAGAGRAAAADSAAERSREATSRLRLDAPALAASAAGPPPGQAAAAVEPGPDALYAQAIAALDLANAALREAIAGASAAAQRIAMLEQENARLRAEAVVSRGPIARAQAQTLAGPRGAELLPGDDTRRWLVPLLVVLAALGALAGWLGWRLRQLERVAAAAGGLARTAPAAAFRPSAPASTSGPSSGPSPVLRPVERSIPPPTTPATRQPLPPPAGPTPPRDGAVPAAAAVRPETVDDLLDLEQQAEFFVALGHDAAAVDLLAAHLQQRRGTSPLPYLRLLELAGRSGDPALPRSLRERFGARFAARLPDGDAWTAGGGLEHHPRLLVHLQRVWPDPGRAQVWLQSILLGREAVEPLALPAYRELLFLYSLARDLAEPASPPAAAVDLWLPLEAGAAGPGARAAPAAGRTTPAP